MELSEDTYTSIDILTPNQSEAATLTGIEPTDQESAAGVARSLISMGVPTAIVKMGELGVYYASADESGFVPPHSVETVDTVAAGDAFGAALAVALAEGQDLSDAVALGAAAGALAVTKPGAQDAMPSRSEVEALHAGS